MIAFSLEDESLMTPDAYLVFEDGPASGDRKHEYLNGRLIPMIGGTLAHDRIATNILIYLDSRLKVPEFSVYSNAVKVWIEAANAYYYADVCVGRGVGAARSTIAPEPVLVVEVLSPGTHLRDRREKVPNYQRLETLEEVLLVDQTARVVHLFRRGVPDWTVQTVRETGSLDLTSVGVEIGLDAIYRWVDQMD